MRARWRIVLGLVLCLSASGNAGEPQADARAALAKYFAAVKASDWAGMYDLSSEASRAGQSREEFTAAREGGMGADLGKAIQARASYEIGAVRVLESGDRASADVTIRLPDLRSNTTGSLPSAQDIAAAPLHDLQRTMELVVEQGAWRVVRPQPTFTPEARERFEKAVRESAERARQRQTPATGTPD